MLMGSQLATWCLTLAATVVIPRYLGAELIGRLQLATAIWAMGVAVINFGMDLALTKAVARDHQLIGSMLLTSVTTRLLLSIPVTLLLFGYAWLAGYQGQIIVLLVIVGARSIFQTVADSISAILMGLEMMGAISVAAIAGRMLSVGGAVGLLALGFNVYAVAAVGVTGTVLNLMIQLVALHRVRRRLGDDRPAVVDRASIMALLRESMPYFWILLFMVTYQQVDTIVISLVVEDDNVLGWYTVYDRLAGTLMFVPTVFMTAVYPTLSRLYGSGDEATRGEHNDLTQKTFRLMLLISVPLGFGLSSVSRPLIELLYGDEFGNASQVVAVGGIVISLTYLTTVLGMFLISMDRQRQWTRFIALGAMLTIPLDFLLVPFFQAHYDNGAIGGALAYAVTESVILAGGIYLLPRGALGPSSLFYALKVVAAGLIMVAAVYPLRDFVVAVPIAFGALVFGATVVAFRLIEAEERQLLMALVPTGLVPRMMRKS